MSDSQEALLFYTAATRHYVPFIPLFAYFASASNPGAAFEFIVEDGARVEADYAEALAFLRRETSARITMQSSAGHGLKIGMDNTLRFVLPPLSRAEHVYIGDVDIMIVENVMDWHRPVFDAGLPYSNRVRPGAKRLTGLHFTRYDTYYPLPPVEDILTQCSIDEEVLYRIVERKGLLSAQPEIDATGVRRPQHGIHMSLNRIPFADRDIKVHWGILWRFVEATHAIITQDRFLAFVDTLPYASRMFLANLYFIVRGAYPMGRDGLRRFTAPESEG